MITARVSRAACTTLCEGVSGVLCHIYTCQRIIEFETFHEVNDCSITQFSEEQYVGVVHT